LEGRELDGVDERTLVFELTEIDRRRQTRVVMGRLGTGTGFSLSERWGGRCEG